MNSLPKFIRYFLHSLIYIAVSLLVIAAIALSLARLMVPAIDEYKPDIEQWVSDLVGQQVEIATLDAAWYGLEPQLVLKGVQLLSKDRKETYGYFQQARIGLNVIGSIYEGRFQPGALTLEGAHLSIIRQPDGNVTISGLEQDAGKKSNSSNDQVLSDWLLNQRLLDIQDSEIIWQDLKKGENQWRFSQVNLRIRNDEDHHLINGSVTLPEELGARLEVAIDARGDLLSAKGWSGSAYVDGANLRLAQWLKDLSLYNASVSNGMVGLRLWSQWKKAELSSLKGEIYSNGFQISVENAAKIQVIESFSSNISINKIHNIWEATIDKIAVSTSKKIWPQARVDIRYDPKNNSAEAEISYIDLSDLTPVAKLFGDEESYLVKMVSELNPSGIVSNIHLSVSHLNDSAKFLFKAHVSQFANNAWKKIPGFRKLDGQLSLSNNAFRFIMPRQDFVLEYTNVFMSSAGLKNARADLYWHKNETGSTLVANDVHLEFKGAEANGSLKFEAFVDASPNLDLAFYFKNGNVADARFYIPSKIMNKNAVKWINQSLLAGRVTDGGILYFGNVKQYPFYQNEGLFDLDLNIKKGKLSFAKEWPRITAINGKFSLRANGLSFHGNSARSLGSRLSNVDVILPKFRTKDPRLLITGDIKGKSEDKIRYLHTSPLENIFAKNISPLKMTGKSDLALRLDIPLSRIKETQAHGVIKIKNNHLLAEEWKLDIENITTDLVFDNRGISAEKISGRMGDVVIDANIETQTQPEGFRNIAINAQSDIDQKDLAYLLGKFINKAHWANYLKGTTKLNTSVNIPVLFQRDDIEPKINLTLNADLTNIEFLLPYPLDKPADVADTLDLFVELSGEERLLDIKLDELNALFEIMPAGDSQQITRGGIGFGQEAKLPEENSFHFVGHLDYFSWTQWEPVIFPPEGEIPLLSGDGAGGSQYFDVEMNKLEIFGIWFDKTSVQASSGAQLWSIHLSGDDLTGEVFIPVVLSSSPLIINMDKLVVVTSETSDQEDDAYLDPKNMPEVKVKAKSFTFNHKPFGKLEAIAKKIDSGLHLDKFSMKTKHTAISATGDWTEKEEKQTSTFDIAIHTTNLGKTITDWGFADAFGGGVGDVKIKASWPGKPSDFSYETAKGQVDIDVKDANLLDFELGAAKMVGLFIPRRLLLDFRDVFQKGMHFDSIKGQYQIEDGNAYTTNLNLDGPIADIQMAGRIGLVTEDYDQLVTVNRRLVGDSLSTLAALATNPLVNPLLAAQIFALKKLFEKQIDDILSVQYTIKGTWDDPKITPVVKNLKDRGESVDELFDE
ncbi:MAG TPA: TIGR02099 family protein [Gammaproteobacteria bacterium]|nr:TIGR02099 family protein [Gammaproteobacteria bacterium]